MVWPKDSFVGDEAQRKKGVLTLMYPIQDGIIANWDDMEKIWDHIFSELHVTSTDQPVLLTETAINPIASGHDREKMLQIMFETFNVPGMFIANQAMLALHANGTMDGLVVDVGAKSTRCIPVLSRHVLSHAITHLDLAGTDLTEYLAKMLSDAGHYFICGNDRQLVKDIKEKLAYVAFDFEAEMQAAAKGSADQPYELPDGVIATIGSERFRCSEPLFQPSLVGYEQPGIHEATLQCIEKSADHANDLYTNIVLTGGSSMFPGLVERFNKEITALAPPNTNINIVATPERMYSVWKGGSILASTPKFQQMMVTRQEFDERGPALVFQKYAS